MKTLLNGATARSTDRGWTAAGQDAARPLPVESWSLVPRRPYQLEFYTDPAGNSPVERWFQDLDDIEAYALGSALDGLLQESGALLCILRPQYASSLGRGLYEFRLEDMSEGLLRELGKKPRRKLLKLRRKALFRVFFHPEGSRLIVLLGAYDKSKHPSAAFQGSQIEIARKRLAEWLARSRKSTKLSRG